MPCCSCCSCSCCLLRVLFSSLFTPSHFDRVCVYHTRKFFNLQPLSTSHLGRTCAPACLHSHRNVQYTAILTDAVFLAYLMYIFWFIVSEQLAFLQRGLTHKKIKSTIVLPSLTTVFAYRCRQNLPCYWQCEQVNVCFCAQYCTPEWNSARDVIGLLAIQLRSSTTQLPGTFGNASKLLRVLLQREQCRVRIIISPNLSENDAIDEVYTTPHEKIELWMPCAHQVQFVKSPYNLKGALVRGFALSYGCAAEFMF